MDDPRADGWDTEVLASQAGERIQLLAKACRDPESVSAADVADVLAPEFTAPALVPSRMTVVFEDANLRVERGEKEAAPPSPDAPGLRDRVDALRQSLAALRSSVVPQGTVRFETKTFQVKRAESTATTRHYVSLFATDGAANIEENAEWMAQWSLDGAKARLARLELLDFERVRLAKPRPLLEDCAESALGANPSYRAQLLVGFQSWAERIQETRFFALLGTPGVAVGDVDGDDLDDLYLCQEGGLPNRLYIHQADGTARDASAGSGVDWIDSTRSALIIDLDGDGAADLAAATLGCLALARGDGRGRFTTQLTLPTSLDTMSLSAADYDLDGDLDLYLCAYKQDDLAQDAGVLSLGASDAFVYHDSNAGARNYLFRNDTPRGASEKGSVWSFHDATDETGLDANNHRFSFAAAWEDFDNDGDQDLYVANDFGRNNLYRNETLAPGSSVRRPSRFTDVAAEMGAEDSASGMSVSWGDYDRDGWMDLYVGNMFSAAGNRITRQMQFKADASGEVRSRLQRFARGNTLLHNGGGKAFEDVSEAAAVTMGRWAWSSLFFDVNGDGLEDLLVGNGYVTTDDTGDL